MKFYIIRKKSSINAVADYDENAKTITVLKGSRLSTNIAYSKTFRGANSIEKMRSNGNVVDGILTTDMVFKSPSTAANFVTGTSTNGCVAWKTVDGKSWKEAIGVVK